MTDIYHGCYHNDEKLEALKKAVTLLFEQQKKNMAHIAALQIKVRNLEHGGDE